MKNSTKWIVGIALFIIVLFVVPFFWGAFIPFGGYGMMRRGFGYGYPMPMMGGFGGLIFLFGGLLMWLIPIGILVLIGLGIAWLVKALTNKLS